MDHPRHLFHLFSSFATTVQFLQQINVKKCSSSIQCWDSNPLPLEHESPPITTRPGLPPIKWSYLLRQVGTSVIKLEYKTDFNTTRYAKVCYLQRNEQCDQHLVKFRHFGKNFKSLWPFLKVFLYLCQELQPTMFCYFANLQCSK